MSRSETRPAPWDGGTMQPSRIQIARALVRRRADLTITTEERDAIPILAPMSHDPRPLIGASFDLGALTLAIRFLHIDAESHAQARAMLGAVIDLLDLDPNGAEADELRAELERLAP